MVAPMRHDQDTGSAGFVEPVAQVFGTTVSGACGAIDESWICQPVQAKTKRAFADGVRGVSTARHCRQGGNVENLAETRRKIRAMCEFKRWPRHVNATAHIRQQRSRNGGAGHHYQRCTASVRCRNEVFDGRPIDEARIGVSNENRMIRCRTPD